MDSDSISWIQGLLLEKPDSVVFLLSEDKLKVNTVIFNYVDHSVRVAAGEDDSLKIKVGKVKFDG